VRAKWFPRSLPWRSVWGQAGRVDSVISKRFHRAQNTESENSNFANPNDSAGKEKRGGTTDEAEILTTELHQDGVLTVKSKLSDPVWNDEEMLTMFPATQTLQGAKVTYAGRGCARSRGPGF
jgi:hypothetical protein